MDSFHYLKVGLAALLVFIGLKMLGHHYLEAIGFETVYSLYVILGILVISVLASLVFPKKKPAKAKPIVKPTHELHRRDEVMLPK